MIQIFKKIFGTKSERDLKALHHYLVQINKESEEIKDLCDNDLREKTRSLKKQVKEALLPISQQIENLEKEGDLGDMATQERCYAEVDCLKKERTQILEKTLDLLLPQAFAIVKETARRLAENKQLTVIATNWDREIAAHYDYVTISGNQAIWNNEWEVMGAKFTWSDVHRDLQLLGGIILHQGKIAEMSTGEGKTLMATTAAFLNALSGRGVHIVTVNDYLAKRDTAWNGPLYTFHELTVDCINHYNSYSDGRRLAYRADITYGTNNEFGFDYLRDNMVDTPEELVQRGHHYAIIDEVDSALIDDARTPLIISGPVAYSNEAEYAKFCPRIHQLYSAQRELANRLLQEAKQKITAGDEKPGGLALFRVYRGLPKYKPLIKYLSETGKKQLLRNTEDFYLQENSVHMPEADEPLYFTIDEQHNSIDITEKGLSYITESSEDANFFVMPDIGSEMAEIDQDTTLNTTEKTTKKDSLVEEYTVKSQRIHIVRQLLKAYALFEKDIEYIVVSGKVKIVDEQTGRVLSGRRYSDGLHQALEAKEQVNIEKASQTYATITLQNYFRMYHKSSGMTGTAITEAGEFWEIYKLDVVIVPTYRPVVREDRDDQVYKTMREKFNAVIEEIAKLTEAGRPVLVGTTSVEISELVSRMLSMRKIKHQVLNARHHQKESEIITHAGESGTVTIATNMAGRGTDIKLSPESRDSGGLAIVGTERHESRRVDRQLRGRSGRQGDVGSSQFFLSLEDDLMRRIGSGNVAKIMDKMGLKEGEVIQHPMITKSIERAQTRVEQANFSVRKRMLEYDNVMNVQRDVVYKKRRHALYGRRLQLDLMHMFRDVAAGALQDQDQDKNKLLLCQIFGKLPDIDFEIKDPIVLVHKVWEGYQMRQQTIQLQLTDVLHNISENYAVSSVDIVLSDKKIYVNALIDVNAINPYRSLEKQAILYFIDQYWKDHLCEMDELKQSVQNAAYEQKDPLLIYKFESYKLFEQLVQRINLSVVGFLCRAELTSCMPQRTARLEKWLELDESKNDMTEKNKSISVPRRTIQRNARVSVRYRDGKLKENVKYKTIENDVIAGECVVIDS